MMTKQIVLAVAAFYGLTSVILGALGSHALTGILSPDKLVAFETGIKYQMYHALALLVLGFFLPFVSPLEKTIAWSLITGTLLFSGSIYLLCMASYWKINLKFLGPITPMGGLALIVGWACLLVYFLRCAKH